MAMTVYLRNIKNQEHPIHVEEEDKLSKLFDGAMEGFPGAYSDSESILLIFKGKVLSETQSVKDAGLKNEDRVVVMTRKKKELGKRKAAPKKEEPKEVSKPTPAAAVPPASPIKKESAASAMVPAAANPAAPAAAEANLTEEQETKVLSLTSMGFNRPQVVPMLEAANWNVDTAGQLLLELAEEQDNDQTEDHVADAAGRVPLSLGAIPTGCKLSEDHPLYEFCSSDIFQEMRRAVRQDPSSMVNYIMEMIQANPEMAQEVMAHERDFMSELLGGPEISELLNGMGAASGDNEAAQREAMMAQQQAMNATMANIESEFTADDKEAIQRLMEVSGMPRPVCIEAYMACDKNEQYAANFLFDQF